MAEHNELGIRGEKIALNHLHSSGFEIVTRNWRIGREEIDIIAQKGKFTVFVEVKTRSSNDFGEPESFVTRKKQKRIIKAANAYIEMNDLDTEARFDIIAITFVQQKFELEHLEDAFYPLL